jgi:signal transduction histidine kinase
MGLTKQLLAFSRQQVLEAKVLNLNQSVAGMEKMLRRLLGADIELTMLPASGLWNVKADPGQVEQLLMNLHRDLDGRVAAARLERR